MKPLVRSFLLLLMVALVRSTSFGMGYPQDMFAEHVTVKEKANTAQAVGRKVSAPTGQKAGSARASSCTSACNKKAAPQCEKNIQKSAAAGKVKSTPLALPFQRAAIVAVKVFNMSENEVKEKVISLEELLNSTTQTSADSLLAMLWKNIIT